MSNVNNRIVAGAVTPTNVGAMEKLRERIRESRSIDSRNKSDSSVQRVEEVWIVSQCKYSKVTLK